MFRIYENERTEVNMQIKLRPLKSNKSFFIHGICWNMVKGKYLITTEK